MKKIKRGDNKMLEYFELVPTPSQKKEHETFAIDKRIILVIAALVILEITVLTIF